MTRRRRAIVVLIAPLKRARLVPSVGAIATSLAVWVSFGTIGFDVPGGSRIGLLPVAWWYPLVALAPAGVVFWILNRSTRQGGEGHSTLTNLTPLLPLALLALPWLPFRVPAVFLIWTGAVTTLVWVAVAMALAATVIRGNWVRIAFGPGASCLAAGALSLLVFSTAAWSAAGRLPAGDEPHYLIITQSLLLDHDLKIENNHRRGDYRAYVGADLYPDSVRRGRNGELYSIHSPGLPLLVLPAFAIGGYRAVVMFLLVLASAGGALAWWLAWRVTKSSSAAWFGWAVVVMSPPFLLESFTIYPDAPGATIVLTGFWALLRADWDVETRSSSWLPWLAHGAALGVLPWLHTRFSVIAATLGGLILIRLARTSNAVAKASAFLALPAVSALAWLGFFVVIYGTPDPSAPYGGQMQNSFSFLPDGVGGLFFDQGFGLLTTAPVLVVAFAGLRRSPRLALDWLVIAIPYLLAVTTFAMWWAGWSGPARFFVPLLLPLAIFAACGWQAIRERGTRASVAAAFVATCWLSLLLVFVNGAQLAYHGRNPLGVTGAPWIDWAVHFVNIRLALPAFVPLPFGTSLAARDAAARSGFLTLAPWVICLTVAAIARSSTSTCVRVGALEAPYPSNIPWPTVVRLGDGSWLLVAFDGTVYGGPLPGYGTHGDVVLMRARWPARSGLGCDPGHAPPLRSVPAPPTPWPCTGSELHPCLTRPCRPPDPPHRSTSSSSAPSTSRSCSATTPRPGSGRSSRSTPPPSGPASAAPASTPTPRPRTRSATSSTSRAGCPTRPRWPGSTSAAARP